MNVCHTYFVYFVELTCLYKVSELHSPDFHPIYILYVKPCYTTFQQC